MNLFRLLDWYTVVRCYCMWCIATSIFNVHTDVGRSCILLTIGGKNLMLDCGMHMGAHGL